MLEINKIYNLDCREGLRKLEDNSIDCCITSPPYWSLRDYGLEPSIWDGEPNCEHEWDNERIKPLNLQAGNPEFQRNWREKASNENSSQGSFCQKCGAWVGCLGLEPTFELYIKHLADIYDLVKQKLKKNGTCFVNIGDTYGTHGSGSKKSSHNFRKPEIASKEGIGTLKKPRQSVPEKCLCLIPQRFAIEMVNRGWILRNVIIWHKPNCMPSSAKDRFTVDFEYVYFFTKNKKYYFEQQREPLQSDFIYSRNSAKGGVQEKNNPRANWKDGLTREEFKNNSEIRLGRNKRCVWTIPTQPNPEAHFATFNPDLITPMIKAGCPEFVCKKCGKPREKIIKIKRENTRKGEYTKYNKTKDSPFRSDTMIKRTLPTEIRIEGYTDCGCNAGFDSGIVLDPFAGTGTTLYTAWNLGRNYIGFELSADYCKIAEKMLSQKRSVFERNKNKIITEKTDFSRWL